MTAESAPPSARRTTQDQHQVTTQENGAFCIARCRCGWHGPARRSRDRARLDATTHLG